MIVRIKELYTKWNNSLELHRTQMEKEELFSQFQVREMGGELYITCNGTPYKYISPELTAKEITDKLNEARLAALHYRKMNRTPFAYLKTEDPNSSENERDNQVYTK